MLPSLFTSAEDARPWSVPRAALYGGGIGLIAGLVKALGPFHNPELALPLVFEIGLAAAAFALLCAGAALLRNVLVRRLLHVPRRRP